MKTLKKPRAAARKPKATRMKSQLNLPCPKIGALEVIGRLPDDVTWDQVLYHLEVRQGIERGLKQIATGQHRDAEEVFDELLRDEE